MPNLALLKALRTPPESDELGALGIDLLEVPGAQGTFDKVRITGSKGSIDYALTAPIGIDDEPIEVVIDLDADYRERISAFGMIGFRPNGAPADGIKLQKVRLALWPKPPGGLGTYSSDSPFFALYFDWRLPLTLDESREFGSGSADIQAEAEFTLTSGFSAVHPPANEGEVGPAERLGVRNLQLRLDLDFMGASTGWFPLSLIETGFPTPYDIPDLTNWFDAITLPDWPDLPSVKWPDWNLAFPLKASFPFGLRFREHFLSLKDGPDGIRLEACAQGLVADWEGEELFESRDIGFTLRWAEPRYEFEARILAFQYPEADKNYVPGQHEPQSISLPFGALKVSAVAWRITVGLFAQEDHACPELILELAELKVSSSLWGNGQPLYTSPAIRLHLRGNSLLCCDAPGGSLLLFSDVGVDGSNWLTHYREDREPTVSKLSIAEPDEAAQDSEPEEAGPVTFLRGEFEQEQFLRLEWDQDNTRLIELLRSCVPGLSSQDPVESGEDWRVGLELAYFDRPEGRDTQFRLEWGLSNDWQEEVEVGAGSPLPTVATEQEVVEKQDGNFHLKIPEAGPELKKISDTDLRVDLSLIEAKIASPKSRGLLFYQPANQAPTYALVNIYRDGTREEPRTVAEATLDFSLSGDGERQALPTSGKTDEEEKPFLRFAIGARTSPRAVAVASWKEGEEVRIMQAHAGQGVPFASLLTPAQNHQEADCSTCPRPPAPAEVPLRLPPEDFGTPRFGADWQLDLEVHAKRALRGFLGDENDEEGLVHFEVTKVESTAEQGPGLLPKILIHTLLEVRFSFAGNEAVSGTAIFEFDPGDLSMRLVEGGTFEFKLDTVARPEWAGKDSYDGHVFSRDIELFGLKTSFFKKWEQGKPVPPPQLPFLQMDLRDGRFGLSLLPDTDAVVRFDLGDDALVFVVSELIMGPGGLDLEAMLDTDTPLKLRGLSRPFSLKEARLEIRGGRMNRLNIGAGGCLPEMLSHSLVEFDLVLSQEKAGGKIELEECAAVISNSDKPIFTTGVEYQFTLDEIRLRYEREGGGQGGRHFYFEISGAAQFKPKSGKFDGGMLANLKAARCEFTRAPVCDEFTDHLTFMVELNKPVHFKVFELFRMEIRAFGFMPKYDFPGGEPKACLIIAGQCEFAQSGDVVSAEIDFHRLYLGMPRKGSSLPQIDFKELRVEIEAAEGFRIGGAVVVYDEQDREGFAGDGLIEIPGLPLLGAAFAFVRIRDDDGEWKHAWFIAVQMGKISYQLLPLPVYLRQVGLGFGYRYTSVMLAEQPENATLQELVDFLLAQLDKHHELARLGSWIEDVEASGDPRWTIAMEGVFTLGTSQSDPFKYEAEEEQKLRTVVLQAMAAIRSDLTMAAGAKAWFPINYDDFLTDRDNMRSRPLAKGFIHYSPRHQRLLTYARKEKGAYYGDPDDELTELVSSMLEPVPFEFAAVVSPKRIRGELGWVDRLVYPLKIGPLELECRGGILFAAEKGAIVHGFYFAAKGGVGLSGKAGGGSLGLRVSAHAKISFSTRLLVAVPIVNPLRTDLYGQIGLDISVRFSVYAWFKFKAGFVKIKLTLRFSFSVQIVVALEVGIANGSSLGFKGRAKVSISVFGRKLSARVAVGVNERGVERARRELRPYMSSMLEPGKIPPIPEQGGKTASESGGIATPMSPLVQTPAEASSQSVQPVEALAEEPLPLEHEFAFSVLPLGDRPTEHGAKRHWLLWIMPAPHSPAFYPCPGNADWAQLEVKLGAGEKLWVLKQKSDESPAQNKNRPVWSDETSNLTCDFTKRYPVEGEEDGSVAPEGAGELTLQQAIAGCYRMKGASPEFPFDFDYDSHADDLQGVDAGIEDTEILSDERVADGPRFRDPEMDPHHAYDAALIRAIEEAEEDDALVQARSSQGFLLRGFQDDIADYARTFRTIAVEGGQAPIDPPASRAPALWDTGMAVILEAEKLPEWARNPLDDGDAEIPRPKLTMGEKTYDLRPLADIDSVRFDGGRVGLSKPPLAHFDEDLLALDWELDWNEGEAPRALGGVDTSIEGHLSHYRVQLFALSAGAQVPLIERDILPLKVLSPSADGDNKQVALRPRYQVTIPVDELFAADRNQSQTLRRVLAVVTPVSQTGEEAESFSVVAEQEPHLTPLPADKPSLQLSQAAGEPVASLSWTEPALPNTAGVAATDSWELILRAFDQVPLGAYPQDDDAADADDLTGSRDVIAGDIILRMSRQWLSNAAHGAGFKINLPGSLDGSFDEPVEGEARGAVKWLDHRGQKLEGKGLAAAKGFVGRKSAVDPAGNAWKLFIRARRKPMADDSGNEIATYSSMAPVRIEAWGVPSKDEDSAEKNAKPPVRPVIPLLHFEWPMEDGDDPLPLPQIVLGDMHVPLPSIADMQGRDGVDYVSTGSDQRVLTTIWTGAQRQLSAHAAFTVWERNEDLLTNADLAEENRPEGFGVNDVQITRFSAIDHTLAADIPATLAETQNWQSWSPARASILRWQASEDASERPALPKDLDTAWYGWSDARLIWPPVLETETTRNGNRAVKEDGDRPIVHRRNLHGLLGQLIERLISDWADPEGFTLEIGYGANDNPPASHLKWMEGNSKAKDPAGWAALWHLGLAAEISARDKFTGEPVAQDVLVAKIEASLTKILAGFEPDSPATSLARHLAIDLPIKPNDGISASPGKSDLRDLSLNRVQLSLKPLAEARCGYCIVEVPITYGDGMVQFAPPEISFVGHVMLQGLGSSTVEEFRWQDGGAMTGAQDVLRRGRGKTLIFKYVGGKDTGERLKSLLEQVSNRQLACELVTQPLSEMAEGSAKKWPHGTFGDNTARLKTEAEKKQDDAKWLADDRDFADFLKAYLGNAPLRPADGAADDDTSDDTSTFSEAEQLKIARTYLGWARRFFALSPIVSASGANWRFTRANTTTTALRSTVVDALAPARDGTYRYSSIVSWELGTSRARYITATGRYQRLRERMGLAQAAHEAPQRAGPQVLARSYRVPRIRKLQPPQLAGERLIRTTEPGNEANDLQCHEITITRHEEDALQRKNMLLSGKLEYTGMQMAFRRSFRFTEWADKVAPGSVMLPVLEDGWRALPLFKDSDKDFLIRQPDARFGATTFLSEAQPFYYEAELALRATAVATASDIVSRKLAISAAEPLKPRPGNISRAMRQEEWADAEMRDLAAAWVATDNQLRMPLQPNVTLVEIRFPRLLESISSVDRERETRTREQDGTTLYSAAYLPDSEALIQVVKDRDAQEGKPEVPLFSLRPLTNVNESDDFTAVSAAPGLDIILASGATAGPQWYDGVMLKIEALPQPAIVDALELPESVRLAQHPVDEGDADFYNSSKLPQTGRFAALAPLAVRLHLDTARSRLRLREACPLSRSQASVWRSAANAAPVMLDALHQAIRLLADNERMYAAKKIEAEALTAPADMVDRLEGALGCGLRQLREDDFNPDVWLAIQEHLDLWTWSDGVWIEIGEDPPERDSTVFAALKNTDAGAIDAFDEFLGWTRIDPQFTPLTAKAVVDVSDRAHSLATQTHPAFDRAWQWQDLDQHMSIWAQRGNDPRTAWKGWTDGD